ncbi:MAG: hypothetical protein A2X18_07735 [Bacteroidetes bacterium GWF2_40_14]|nr:MAG: hypothetical protein A2X18_07735 [Bacteroidetes bacterium GWF2_40_14]
MNRDGSIWYAQRLDNDKLNADIEQSNKLFKSLGDKAEIEGARIDNAFGKKLGLAAGLAAATAAATGLVKKMIDVRSEFQNTEAAFKVFLGSEEKAAKFMQDMQKYAYWNVFEFKDLTTEAAKLLAFRTDVNDVIDVIDQLSNVASATSKPLTEFIDLYNKAKSRDKLMSEDIEQWATKGVDIIYELANASGKSEQAIWAMVKNSEVRFTHLQGVLKGLTSEGGQFYGIMEEKMKTLGDSIGLLNDTITATINDLGKDFQEVLRGGILAANWAIENYQEIGKVLLELVAVYGTYKATLIVMMALGRLNNAILRQAVLEKALAAKATITLSNAEAIAAAMTKLFMVAQQGLIATTKKLTGALLANPYVMLAAAVAALGFTIYKLATYKSEATIAAEELQQAEMDLQVEVIKETTQLDLLYTRLKAAKEGTDDWKKAKNAIQKQYADYFEKLKKEGKDVNDLAAAYDGLKKSIEEAAKAKAYNAYVSNESDVFAESIGDLREKLKSKLTGKFGEVKGEELFLKFVPVLEGKEKLTKELSSVVSQFDQKDVFSGQGNLSLAPAQSTTSNFMKTIFARYKNAKDTFDAALKNAETKFGKPQEEDVPETVNDEVKLETLNSITESIRNTSKNLADLRLKAQKGMSEELTQSIKEEEDKLKALEDKYEMLTGKKFGSKTQETDADKAKKKYDDEVLSQEEKLHQDKFTLKKESTEDNIELIKIERDEAIDAINKEAKAYKDLAKEAGIKSPDMSVFDNRVATTKDAYQKQIDKKTAENKKKDKETLEELLKDYETFEEQKTSVNKKYDDERKKIEKSGLSEDVIAGKVAVLEKKRKEALKGVSDSELNSVRDNADLLIRIFSNTSDMSRKRLKETLESTKQLVNYLTGVNQALPEGITKESADKMKLSAEEIKAVLDQLDEQQTAYDKQTNYPFAGFIKGFEALKESAGYAKKALAETDEKKKKLLNDQADAKQSQGVNYIVDGAVQASGYLTEISDKFMDLAEVMGDSRFKSFAEQFQAMTKVVSAAAQGAASGGWIGAVVGAATSVITQTIEAFTIAKAEEKEFEQNHIDFLNAYQDLLFQIKNEDFESVFGVKALSKAAAAASNARDAIKRYNDELSGRTLPEIEKENRNSGLAFNFGLPGGRMKELTNEYKTLIESYKKGYSDIQGMAVKTKDQSGWANFWGFKDEYKSLFDLAPELWNKDINGEFDIDAAKAFLETNTQISDEQRKQIQNIIDLKDAYDENVSIIKQDIEDTFGDLGKSVVDILVQAVTEGADAFDLFEDAGAAAIERLGEKLAYELFFAKKFENFEKDILDSYDLADPQAIANKQLDLLNQFFSTIGTDMDNAQDWMDMWKKKAAEKGFDIWDTERTATSRGIATASQDSVDLNNSLLTTQTSLIRDSNDNIKSLQSIGANIHNEIIGLHKNSSAILEKVSGIKEDTARLENIENTMESVNTTLGLMETRGIKVRM